MKKISNRCRYIVVLCIILHQSIVAFANGVEIGGIHYILDEKNATASVTCTGEIETVFLPLFPITTSESDYKGQITIPDKVTYSGKTYNVTAVSWEAFKDCTQLTRVSLHDKIRSIGENAFFGCTNLSSITFANSGLKEIGDQAFKNCNSLKEIILPKTLKEIGSSAFEGSGINTITCLAYNPPDITEITDEYEWDEVYTAFDNFDKSKCTLIVPKATKEKYIKAWDWPANNVIEKNTQDDETIKLSVESGVEISYNGNKTNLNGKELIFTANNKNNGDTYFESFVGNKCLFIGSSSSKKDFYIKDFEQSKKKKLIQTISGRDAPTSYYELFEFSPLDNRQSLFGIAFFGNGVIIVMETYENQKYDSPLWSKRIFALADEDKLQELQTLFDYYIPQIANSR